MTYPRIHPVQGPTSKSPLPYYVLTPLFSIFAESASRFAATLGTVGWIPEQSPEYLNNVFGKELQRVAATHPDVLWEAVVIQLTNDKLVLRLTAKPVDGEYLKGSSAGFYDLMKSNYAGDFVVRTWTIDYTRPEVQV